jgi:dihydroorotate dehydrogenase
MSLLEQAGLRLMHCLDPETAHGLALKALAAGLGPKTGPVTSPRLATTLAGLALPNPVGIAAGFDKNAEVVRAALAAGPGFLEVGAVTPRPQPGNPRPRLFRLAEDQAAINRFGFNNQGMEAVSNRLAAARGAGIVGVNLGANKDAADRAAAPLRAGGFLHRQRLVAQYREAARPAGTRGAGCAAGPGDGGKSRTGRGKAGVPEDRAGPDPCGDRRYRRTGAGAWPRRDHRRGLSGQPLFARSTEVLGQLYRLTGGKVPLVGVGGVATAEQAYAKIRAGASAVQLYTAMVYGGIGLPGRIARGLDRLLERDGFANIAKAVGTGNK